MELRIVLHRHSPMSFKAYHRLVCQTAHLGFGRTDNSGLVDERALPPAGRIAEPEDTIGTVFVQDGQIDSGTYQPMPSYRLVTVNGPLILPKGLDQYVRQRLEAIDREEKA